MLTKRIFERMANIIRAQYDYAGGPEGHEAVRRVAMKLAEMAHSENPRFDSERFFRACGLDKSGRQCGRDLVETPSA
jgi:hypothetical protein